MRERGTIFLDDQDPEAFVPGRGPVVGKYNVFYRRHSRVTKAITQSEQPET